MAEKKKEVDTELEALREQYPGDAVIERSYSGNIRVQLKDTPKAGTAHSGVQYAQPVKPGVQHG